LLFVGFGQALDYLKIIADHCYVASSKEQRIDFGRWNQYLYDDQDRLLAVLMDKVIGTAEAKAKEQTVR
jgi:hypothetical protein